MMIIYICIDSFHEVFSNLKKNANIIYLIPGAGVWDSEPKSPTPMRTK